MGRFHRLGPTFPVMGKFLHFLSCPTFPAHPAGTVLPRSPRCQAGTALARFPPPPPPPLPPPLPRLEVNLVQQVLQGVTLILAKEKKGQSPLSLVSFD